MKPPKTKKSRRTIKLPDVAVRALRRHRADQNKQRLQAGSDYSEQGLVFSRPDGEPWSPDAFTRAFGKLVRASDLGHVRFQDLRHTHATQLLREGIHPKIVSERLGHSNISITLDTYSHILPGMQDEAAERIDAALRTALDAEE
jgi:integrase